MQGGFDDLANDLDAFNAPSPAKRAEVVVHSEPCPKCRGSGRFHGYAMSGPCFKCNGAGKLEFKAPAEVRAKRRASAAASKTRRLQEQAAQWVKDHPAEAQWITRKIGLFDFATAMGNALDNYGSLTEGQLAAVRRCIVADQDRAERKAAEAVERAAAVQAAPAVEAASLAKVEAAFANAKAAGVAWPRLRLASFVFSPAGANSRNAGAIYVKGARSDDGEGAYLGKIAAGKFLRSRDCDDAAESAIVAAASDPEAAAVAFGKMFGRCAICNRTLENKDSIERGIGPICAENMGW